MDADHAEAEAAWVAFSEPYRRCAERLGFQFATRDTTAGADSCSFSDDAVDSSGQGIFLSISGEVREDGSCRLWEISACTYVQAQYLLCRITRGVPVQRPYRSLSVRLLVWLIDMAERCFMPKYLQKVRIKAPSDLAQILALHAQSVLAANGKVLVPGPDPIESKRLWDKRLDDEYDEDGVPRSGAG